MHREKPHKLLQVGVTPTPATNPFSAELGMQSAELARRRFRICPGGVNR